MHVAAHRARIWEKTNFMLVQFIVRLTAHSCDTHIYAHVARFVIRLGRMFVSVQYKENCDRPISAFNVNCPDTQLHVGTVPAVYSCCAAMREITQYCLYTGKHNGRGKERNLAGFEPPYPRPKSKLSVQHYTAVTELFLS